MIYLRKILVTTDLSEYSLAAMEYASSFGMLYTSKLYLLYVVDTGSVFPHHPHEGAGGETHPHPRTEEEARRALEEFVRQNISPDVRLIPVVRRGHNPAAEIRRFAETEGADLIVIATHGRTGLRHVVLGSVAERVVRTSRVPVLTVKPRPLREQILEEEDVERELHLK